MIITHHREKLINAIVYFSKNVKYCGKTKLLKLLYFLDFGHFKQTGKSVTGLEYFTWERGPCPSELFAELSGKMKPDLKRSIGIKQIDNFFKVSPKTKFNKNYFSTRELRLLKSLAYTYIDAKADEMVEITHFKNEPWERTKRNKGMFQPIDYLLAVDNTNNSLALDEAKERSQEITEMYKIFGTVQLHIRGTVFHHPELVFHNGVTGNKYLILLNSPHKSDPYFFVKTTSKQKNKTSTPGCSKSFGVFFLNTSSNSFFPLPTWVQLYEHYLFSQNDVEENSDLTKKGSIESNLVDTIIECLFLVAEDDLSIVKKRLLRPPVEEYKLLLAKKFNVKR